MSFGLKFLAQRVGVAFATSLVLLACKGGGTGTPDTGVDDGGVVDMGMVEDGDVGDACSAQPDEPDLAGADTNCDGIDGDEDDAIFVTTNGAMTLDPSVGTRANPAGGITFGLSLAMTRGKSQVLVASGTYTEAVTIVAGIGVHGSYDNTMNWARTFATSTHIAGTMAATNIATRTPITRLTVTAPDATTPGGSSIAMRIVSSSGIEISDATFTAGTGMPGTAGGSMAAQASGGSTPSNINPSYRVPGVQVNGGDNLTNPEVAGGSKSNHAMPNAFDCSGLANCGQVPLGAVLTERAPGGTNACGCGVGGQGGTRLVIPTSLTLAAFQDFIGSFIAGLGGAGSSGETPGATCAPRVQGGGGAGGYWSVSRLAAANLNANYIGSMPSTVVHGAPGTPGDPGADGEDGDPGTSGTFDLNGFVPANGTAGAVGVGGQGGQGGGSGASTLCADEGVQGGVENEYEELWVVMTGGMGGGGGAGGCPGAGGNPGAGGGASIAIFVWDSEPTFVRVTATGGTAGAGGAGQPGQPGGSGGNGAAGRDPYNAALGFGDTLPSISNWLNANAQRWCVGGTNGGSGGRGGDGGDGGGGGGGAGGASIGIVLAGGSTTSATSSEVTATGGTAGAGGAGGDANPGAAGSSVGTFTMP